MVRRVDTAESRVRQLARRQDGVVTTAQAASLGLAKHDLRRYVRRGEWQRAVEGAYVLVPEGDPVPWRAWPRAASLVLPGATVGLGTAARLHGLAGVPRREEVQVVVPPGRELQRRPRLDPHVWPLDPADVVDVGGIPVTSVVRTLADLVPRLGRLDAIAVLDSALSTRLASPADLELARRTAAGRPGCRHVDDLWGLADGRAGSPLESRVRLRAVEGGLPPDELQHVVRTADGHVVGRADLAYHRRRRPRPGPLLVEADGKEVHGQLRALSEDRYRANALVAADCDVIRCTWFDTLSAHRVPAMVRAAL